MDRKGGWKVSNKGETQRKGVKFLILLLWLECDDFTLNLYYTYFKTRFTHSGIHFSTTVIIPNRYESCKRVIGRDFITQTHPPFTTPPNTSIFKMDVVCVYFLLKLLLLKGLYGISRVTPIPPSTLWTTPSPKDETEVGFVKIKCMYKMSLPKVKFIINLLPKNTDPSKFSNF